MDFRNRTDLYDNGPGDSRSYDDFQWLDKLGWKRKLPIIARQINDFMVYIRFCKHASEEEIWQLHEIQKKQGLTIAIENMIREVSNKRYNAYVQKQQYIREIENRPVTQIRELEEQFAEEERWRHLPESERRKKYMQLPVQPGCPAPALSLDIVMAQELLEEQIADDGVGYRIYDKIYDNYSAVVFSPMRADSDGTIKSGQVIRYKHRNELYSPIRQAIGTERQEYNQWLARGYKPDYFQQGKPGIIGRQSPIQGHSRAASANVNIDHVKKAMGLQGNRLNDELNGNIF